MKKKIIFSLTVSLIAVIVAIIIKYILNMISPTSHLILNNNQISSIKHGIVRENVVDYEMLTLRDFEGSNKYISLKFQNGDSGSSLNSYYVIYSVKEKKSFQDVKNDKHSVNIVDASTVKYIGHNEFIIISSKGDVYKYTPLDSENLSYIGSTCVRNSNAFKTTFYKDSLYILTRNELNNFNEKPYNESSVIEINCENKKTSIKEYPLSKNDYVFSFINDSAGNIGVLRSSTIDMLHSEAEIYTDTNSGNYIENMPSLQGKIRFINSNDISVIFFKDNNRVVKIGKESLKVDTDYMFDKLNEKMSSQIGYTSNVPVFLYDNKLIMYKGCYEDFLFNKQYISSATAVYYDTSTKEFGEDIELKVFDIVNFNYKKYITFVKTNMGYIGIKEDGTYDKIVGYDNIFINDKIMLYEANENISYAEVK